MWLIHQTKLSTNICAEDALQSRQRASFIGVTPLPPLNFTPKTEMNRLVPPKRVDYWMNIAFDRSDVEEQTHTHNVFNGSVQTQVTKPPWWPASNTADLQSSASSTSSSSAYVRPADGPGFRVAAGKTEEHHWTSGLNSMGKPHGVKSIKQHGK